MRGGQGFYSPSPPPSPIKGEGKQFSWFEGALWAWGIMDIRYLWSSTLQSGPGSLTKGRSSRVRILGNNMVVKSPPSISPFAQGHPKLTFQKDLFKSIPWIQKSYSIFLQRRVTLQQLLEMSEKKGFLTVLLRYRLSI